MRRGLTLAWMLVAVLLLGALWQRLQITTVQVDAPATTDAPAYQMLYTRAQSDFADMTVTLASGESYTVRSDMGFDENGNLLGVYNSLSQPMVVDGQEDFALATISYQMMLLTAQNLPYIAAYPSLDAGACGLSAPAARITIHYHQGDTIELSIGNLTASGTSCYVAMAGSDETYLVPYDFYDVMTLPLTEHHRLPGALTMDVDDAVQIAVTGTDDGQIIASCDSSRLLPWQVTSPIVHDGSTERIEAFITGVCALSADAYVDTVTDAQGLARYGLDQPQRLIVAFSNGTIRDIHLGSDAGEGMVYARMDSSGDIYLISRSQLTFAQGVGLNTLLDRFVALVPLNTLLSADIILPDTSYTLSLTWMEDSTAEPDDYLLDGASIPRESWTALYAKMIALQFDRADLSAEAGEALAGLRFTLRDGTQTMVMLYAYDHHYALAQTSGGLRCLVRLESIDQLMTYLEEECS